MDRMEQIKNHFDEEAAEYDGIIQRLIPHYDQMREALALALPFGREEEPRLLDLGCGTGNLSLAVKEHFPRARFALVDLSEKMLELARNRLGEASVESVVPTDFRTFEFPGRFDGIISSLALHHLETNRDKEEFYGSIHGALKRGGAFFNADVVQASRKNLQDRYMAQWTEFMNQNEDPREVRGKWIPKYFEEDRPAPLTAFCLGAILFLWILNFKINL